MTIAASASVHAASRPAGAAVEKTLPSRTRPIDLVHLARQTLGDRGLEREVLVLFRKQAEGVDERIDGATYDERRHLAHGLRGSAAGIGAFPLSDAAADVERNPSNDEARARLRALIAETLLFMGEIAS